jgi:hypothetical protein
MSFKENAQFHRGRKTTKRVLTGETREEEAARCCRIRDLATNLADDPKRTSEDVYSTSAFTSEAVR